MLILFIRRPRGYMYPAICKIHKENVKMTEMSPWAVLLESAKHPVPG
jgi:hypothetical protein